MNLGTFKGKKVAAQKGFDLLKSKADALKVKYVIYCIQHFTTHVHHFFAG
jgi:hypothetical protein